MARPTMTRRNENHRLVRTTQPAGGRHASDQRRPGRARHAEPRCPLRGLRGAGPDWFSAPSCVVRASPPQRPDGLPERDALRRTARVDRCRARVSPPAQWPAQRGSAPAAAPTRRPRCRGPPLVRAAALEVSAAPTRPWPPVGTAAARNRCSGRGLGRVRGRRRAGRGGRGGGRSSRDRCSHRRSRRGGSVTGRRRRRGRRRATGDGTASDGGAVGDTDGQEPSRVEIALLVARDPDTQVDVRRRHLGVAAGADRPDRVALGNRCTLRDEDRAEMGERDCVPVPGEDRDTLAGGGDGPGERDRTALRRDNCCARVAGDVDPAVLPGRIRMSRIEGKRLDDVARSRPGPRACAWDEEQRRQHGRRKHASHRHLPRLLCCQKRKRLTTVGAASSGRQAS